MKFPPERIRDDLWRAARMRALERQPFTPDRLGMYASLWQENLLRRAIGLYLFDGRRRLTYHTQIRVAENSAPLEYCPILARIFAKKGAALLGLSVCATEFSTPTMTDVFLLSRAAMFCESTHIPVLDMILLYETSYIPLSRTGGDAEIFTHNLLNF